MSGFNGLEIAIIGMAGRFPGARDLRRFWRNLSEGVESVARLTDEELLASKVPPELLHDPDYVKAAVLLEETELFDAAFFDIPPREAEMIDPQQRLLLECAFEALERAGYAGTRRPAGVFAGTSRNTYFFHNLATRPDLLATVGQVSVNLASAVDFIATRISYELNLTGPALTVQTACSTSLVATHLACQSLLAGECELALAGGASVRAVQKIGYLYQRGGINSPDGHCRPFDARGQGIISGQGAGVVVLKLLADALADGDHIHAVIRGSAINNDGSSFKAGFTAPSREGQAGAIGAAYLRAQVDPGSIACVEAHGTATPLGDPIEIAALERVFRPSTERRHFCAIGSVKSNLGHLDAAAGIAGLIKTVLALEHGAIPPSLNFAQPNPEIDFASSPFYVNTRLTPWPADAAPRRAGVTSLGLGGTNAHVVLEEAPPPEPASPSRPWQLLLLSARTATALESATDELAHWLEENLDENPAASLPDVAYTLQVGRRVFEHRRALVCRTAEEARQQLAERAPRSVWTAVQEAQGRPVAFLLPGVGDHYPEMAQGLYANEPVFRREVDLCAEILTPHLGRDLRKLLFAGGTRGTGGDGPDLRRMLARDATAGGGPIQELQRTEFAQPAVFVIDHALAKLWTSWGVRPEALIGYSLGEYVAACLAGVFSLEDALGLVAVRARLIADLPAGAMLAVPLAEGEARDLLSGDLCLAAANGLQLSVVSGPDEQIAGLAERLAAQGVPARRLPATHAFHSRMMEPVAGLLASQVRQSRPAPPRIPFLSNVTGTWITPDEAVDPAYWSRHLCSTVRFSQGLAELWNDPARILLEVGAGNGLSSLALQHPAAIGGRIAIPSLPHAQDRQGDLPFLLGALGRLWLAGAAIDWTGFYAGERRRRKPLPTYPFERRRHWVEPGDSRATPATAGTPAREAAPGPVSPPVRSGLRPAYVEPATETEQQIAGAIRRLLGIEDVGRHDSFFELGGNSLVGTRLISLLRAELGPELSIEALFEAPTVAELAERVRGALAEGMAGLPPILPVPRDGGLPLSFTQERFWFLEQLLPGTPAHNIPEAIRLAGPFDRAVLDAAISEVVRRHEVLRTTFPAVDGGPRVRISPPRRVSVPAIDLSGLAPAAGRAEAFRLASEEPRRPLDVATGPLLRATLLRLEEGGAAHLLLLTFHHIVADGWSLGVFNSELATLYGAFVRGAPSPLAELPTQYVDYAAGQRRYLDGPALSAGLAYWKDRLGSGAPDVELPADRLRPPLETLRGARRPFTLSAEWVAQLASAGRARNATLFMTLLAALDVLVVRLTGQADLTVGTPVSGRTRAEIEGLIGPFINTLALRVDLSGDPTYGELLERARDAAIGAYAHQDVPFERVVETVRPERNLGRSPLFQILFMLQNTPAATLSATGLELRPMPVYHGVARFDLTLVVSEVAGGLSGYLEYKTDLLDASTAERWASHLQTLLARAAGHPEARLSALSPLSEAERHNLLHEWNDSPAEESMGGVHRLFAAQALRTPDAPAVAFQGRELTYAELARRSALLARRLRSLGCGPETRVGVALERSLDMPAALLGVLASGAAYVPLDPEYPYDRLAFVLEDAAPRVLITQEHLLSALPPAPGVVLCLGSEPVDGGPDESALVPWDDRQLAYVLYTSGSTGRPKGVGVSHQALVNFLHSMRRIPGFAPGERLLAVTSLAFDIAALEIFLPLTAGGCVELAGRDEAADGVRLADRLRASGAGVLQATPATWRMLLDAGWTGDPGLRALCGGEALPQDLAVSLAGCTGELWNLYGPTETTVWSATARIRPGATDPVSIGPPIAATRIHLLDRNLQTVPLGVPGELWIGGAGLARGYLGRPDLTAERFLPDPFAAEAGDRLYRTGDLARHLPGGRMEVLGRIDQQVKLRGFRIELGEIEAALARHPAIREAAVALRGGALVAYLVPVEEILAEGVLRGFLRQSLPEPMVPAIFVSLPALPLTPNRKVDRKALPDPGPAGEAGAFVAPRTPIEEAVAGIWAEVLGRELVGIDDDFFTLGGHSLLATQVILRLRSLLGVELPLRALFERPTVRALSAAVDEARGPGVDRLAPPLVPMQRTEDLPLSFAQERLWFLDRLQPESPFYNLPLALELRGALSLPLLAASLDGIAARHEALRTTFRLSGDRPAQVIAPVLRLAPPRIDLDGLPETLRAAEARRLAREEAGRPFDLARGPLFRATLLRLADEVHVALFNQHHIVSDGWSLGILVAELTARYRALAAGEAPALPDLPIQYADFAVWQRRWLHGEVLADRLRWWRERLAGAPHVLELPTDRPRPATQSLRGAHQGFAWSAGLSAGLREISRRQGATLFMTLASLLAALLSRQTGAEDLLLGSPVAGRDQAETERLIGLFVNTLVLRAELAGDPGFSAILGRMREMALGAYAHQDLPFEKLVDSLQPERNLSHTPLFQAMLALQNVPLGTFELPGLTLAPFPVERSTARFDLLLATAEVAGRLTGDLEYSRDLFDPATISRLLGHLCILAEGAVARPEARLSELPLLARPEIHQLEREWNDTAVPRPAGVLLHQLFAARAAGAPDAPALVCADRTLTYGELDRVTDRLAGRLRALGAGPDVAVGVLMERSVEMVVALLGILKAGAAYLPLDPEHPGERLAGMIEEARVPVLLAQERLLPVLPAIEAEILFLEEGWNGAGAEDGGAGLPGISAESVAYVLYTSGSTGRPKGVMIPHSGIVNRLLWMQEAYGLTPDDRVLQKTPYSFDVSVWEFFWPLAAGGCLVVASPGGHRDSAYLARLIARNGVTVMHFVPSMLHAFLDQPGLSGCPSLRLVVASGEALSPELRRRFRERLSARLENLYGPTEAAVDVTAWNCAEAARNGAVPIGRPVANTRIHLLDRSLRPIPIGVAGELCIGGVQLARGYWQRPDLTAERFVPDSCGGSAGGRLYRTGDLARHLPDGSIEFLGRIDHQVKLRGFRIELGEIEAALVALPGVREAVVVAREDTPGDRRLAAYVAGDVAADALRRALRERLPDSMVPAAFVTLAALPLTPNGKVDRKTLPAPEWQSTEESYRPPRTPVEEILAGVWAELLGVERVGTADHFFDLGGHSLLATRVMSRLRGLFDVEMPLRDLFEAPTLAGLAARVEAARRAGAGLLTPPLVPGPRKGPLPLSFAQSRLWFLDRLEPGSPLYNMPVALRAEGPLDGTVLALSLGEIVHRHETLRTVFAEMEGSPVQRIQPATPFGLTVVDLSGLPEGRREPLALSLAGEEAGRPFDLTHGPLLRGVLLRLAQEDHLAALTLHHIVADGWSMGILIREITALYKAFAQGRPSPLPGLPVQYADFAMWQLSWMHGETLKNEISYWRRQLAGLPPRLELPTDRPRPAVQSFRGTSRPARLSTGLARQMQALGRREGATLFMVLLAGFHALLARFSGQMDLAVGTPVAGRHRVEIEEAIGFFVNTLVMRGDLTREPTFRELLGRVRDTALAAHAHQDVPFEKIVQELSPERNLGHSPLFQVMLVLQNAPAASLEIQNLRLRPVNGAVTTAKFDLTLSLQEQGTEISGALEHNRDLFDATTIQRLLAGYERLLEGAVADPHSSVIELPLLSQAELHQVRIEWNPATQEQDCPLVEMFERWAEQTPAAAAVLAPGQTLTYAELDHRANQLARRLRALGVTTDSRAGLCAERSPEMIVAVIGILKAGAAYVPLDPACPRERLAFMIEDARLPVLLTQERLLGSLPHTATATLCLDTGWQDVARESRERLPDRALPDSLAYVIYTSGSTGRPKGVMVHHRGWSNLAQAQRRLFGVRPGARVLQFASLSFDASASEIAMTLTAGATLLLGPREQVLSQDQLTALLRESTVATLPPTALAILSPQELTGLETLVVAGEACPRELARRWSAGRRFFNAYGPTEASVCATAQLYDGGEILPIGRPIDQVQAYVLDAGKNPVPAGVAGEIYLGGTGVARGYLHRPVLTAERFVPDPCGGPAGSRLYRTGDMARHLHDGTIEFLGRIDQQVKIRGFRIETGEIEATLLAIPQVREAAVIAREDRGALQLIAFFVPGETGETGPAEIREHLRQSLPEYMVPWAFVSLPNLPLTTSQKVDRGALMRREIGHAAGAEDGPVLKPQGPIEEKLAAIWTRILGLDRVSVHDNFFDIGGHSLRLVEVQAAIRRDLDRDLPVVELFQHPTIASLASHLGDTARAEPRPHAEYRAAGTDIAIIGMEGRFPGAPDLDRYWSNLRDGIESITRLSDEELLAAGVDPGTLNSPDLVRAEARLDGMDLFDAAFFGFNPREAQALDPQQRLFLEHAWACLEHAGYDPARHTGRIGVFAGSGMGTYAINLFSSQEMYDALDPLSLQTSIDKDYLATRVSYKLGLRGPSFSVQTACSTSLVAVHLARQSLLAGECDMALAGGITLKLRQGTGYLYREGAILSPDGHCRAFDAAARGTVFGSGAGLVLLKRLDDALRDGDTIHAVLKGSAINNDGSQKVGYTAPSVDGQAEAISAALAAAGVSPESITYIEAHGTATPLGDPVEVAALTQAFRRQTGRTGFCAIGSVKTNVGHLDAAAGVAGLIKTVLALEHRQIPPSLHYEEPNPQIDFAASPFHVNGRLAEWNVEPARPRRAGVSAFGIGGTNAHAILEEAPPGEPSGPSRSRQVLVLSARTPGALEEATRNLAGFLAEHPDAGLPDVAWTLQVGRQAFEHRRLLVCAGVADAVAALRDPAAAGRVFTRRQEPGRRAVAFLFPGQGAQRPDMGRDLYAEEPVFRAEIDACAERLLPVLGRDLRELLFPPVERREEVARQLQQTRFAQPALFAVELALARLWISWGIRPEAMIGHSLGEYVAACLAGVFSSGDALELVAARGAMMQELPPGAMLSVELSESELSPELAAVPGLSLAAVNAAALCVVSGPEEAVASLEARLAGRDAQVRRLRTSHAFHSAMMDPVLAAFSARVAGVARKPPEIPFLSNLTGTWITAGQATDPGYWTRHLRETVRFAEGIATLLAGSRAALLEVGPGATLTDLAQRQSDPAARPAPISSLSRGAAEPEQAALLGALGQLWLAGVEVDWPSFHAGERRRRIPLPTYPFQRRRYWIAPVLPSVPVAAAAPVALLLPAGAVDDPAWMAALAARGWRLVTVPDQARPEDLDSLLATLHGPAAPSAPPAETPTLHARPGIDTPYQEPGTETERRLAAIWGALLGIDRVGIHDDFFALGGHSLMAARLVARVRDTWGGEIPLETVFSSPTVARLAVHLAAGGEPQASPAPRIPRVPREGDLPLSFAQQQIWVVQQLDTASPAYNLPAAFRLQGPLDPAAVAWSLRQVVARHEVLRTMFPVVQGWPVQRIAAEVETPLPVIDVGLLEPAQAELEMRALLVQDALRPFDLARGPAFRAVLIRLAEDEHVLGLSFHHICCDGWSWGVLFSELAALYAARRASRPSPLPPLPLQYADFTVWQRDRAAGIEEQLDWWRERMAGQVPLGLAPDRLPGSSQPAGAVETFSLAPELTASLRALGQAEGCTLFMVLLALFKVLLHQRTGREDISVGSPVAGRLGSEVEGLIGNFVNTLVLRTDLAGDPPFCELLARVKETALGAHAHQEAPYEQLVAALHGRKNRRSRLFEVWFVLHNTPAPALELPGLTASMVPVNGTAPRHGLSFSLWPTNLRGLSAALEYRTDLFPRSAVRQMAEDFTTLAQAIVEDASLYSSTLAGRLGQAQRERQETRKQVAKAAGLERLRAKRREAV